MQIAAAAQHRVRWENTRTEREYDTVKAPHDVITYLFFDIVSIGHCLLDYMNEEASIQGYSDG